MQAFAERHSYNQSNPLLYLSVEIPPLEAYRSDQQEPMMLFSNTSGTTSNIWSVFSVLEQIYLLYSNK